MNGLGSASSIKSNQFVAPPGVPLLGFKSLISWGHNILTLGIYPSASTLANEHYIRKLEVIQDDLHKQIGKLNDRWNQLEKDLTSLLDDVSALNEGDSIPAHYKSSINKWSVEKDHLANKELAYHNSEIAASITEIALGPILFIGQLIANILTLGLYGVYKNNALKNRISVLKAQNNFIENHFSQQKNQRSENLQKIAASIQKQIVLKETTKTLKTDNKTLSEQLDGIRGTDAAKAYFALMQAQTQIKALQEEEGKLKVQINALQVKKTQTETALAIKEDLNQQLSKSVANLEAEREILKEKRVTLQAELTVKSNNLTTLQAQFNQLKVKADKVAQLESDIKKMHDVQAHQPEMLKLASKLGPIPPKYQPTAKDGESWGAMDVEKQEVNWPEHKVSFAKLYNKRYRAGRSAAEIAIASFDYACGQLFQMAEAGDMIKLNRSGNTSSTFGRFAIYRYMALDLISGGKVTANGCGGHKLDINQDVNMLPSHSENIMQFKLDAADGKLKPVLQLHYKQRDDFTPSENTLKLRDGVNPVAVKWILDQLTEVEKMHLFNHLMAPVIPSDHPEYVATKNYLKIKDDAGNYIKTSTQIERIQLVSTASELIQDIATAFQMKFEATSLVPSFQKQFDDWDEEAYVKEEDNQAGLEKLPDEVVQVSQGPAVVEWKLNENVLADKVDYGLAFNATARQPAFYDLIKNTQALHQALSPYMGQDLLQTPHSPGTKYPNKVDWATINSQYYRCHQMIGANFEGYGGERCLFSNLIAILVSHKKDITSQNVQRLKNAMAAYLEKLMKAKSTWSIHPVKNSKSPLGPLHSHLKKSAELAEGFEKSIKAIHSCTVEQYQSWLRNDPYNKPNINVGNLTSLEIQLAAYTVGVRIALLPINDKYAGCRVDELGRILPEASDAILGPNTYELLYMGLWVDPKDDTKATYYGLFPKLELNNQLLKYDEDAYNVAKQLDDYWKSIET